MDMCGLNLKTTQFGTAIKDTRFVFFESRLCVKTCYTVFFHQFSDLCKKKYKEGGVRRIEYINHSVRELKVQKIKVKKKKGFAMCLRFFFFRIYRIPKASSQLRVRNYSLRLISVFFFLNVVSDLRNVSKQVLSLNVLSM